MDSVRPITEHFESAHFMLNMEGLKLGARRMILDELIMRVDKNTDSAIKIQGFDLVLRNIKIEDDFFYTKRALDSLQSFFNVRDINGFEPYIVLAATSILNRISSIYVPPKTPSGKSTVTGLISRASGDITPFQFERYHISPQQIVDSYKKFARLALERVMAGENVLEKTNAAIVLFKRCTDEFADLSEKEKKAFSLVREHLRGRDDLEGEFDLAGLSEVTVFERIKTFYAQGRN